MALWYLRKTLSHLKELDNKKYVVDHLLSTKREGMEDLIAYMEEIGFFEAPCSGGNHLACQFGLVHHSRNVMMAAENIGYALLGKVKYAEIRDSVIIAAALHDLGKCGDYGKQMYVPNMIKDGRPTKAEPEQKYKQSEAKPFKRNPALLPIDHATRSIKLATLFIDLTEDEEFAIDDYSVWVAENITTVTEAGTDEQPGFTGYEYDLTQYTKDEYIKMIDDKNASLEDQMTQAQEAMCEIYEMMA